VAEVEQWPASTLEQIAALQSLISRSPATADEAVRRFKGARRDIVARHLETLALLGEARFGPDGAYHADRRPPSPSRSGWYAGLPYGD
jgi:hypothetical protein